MQIRDIPYWAVVLLPPENRAIINDLDATLHGFMLQKKSFIQRVSELND